MKQQSKTGELNIFLSDVVLFMRKTEHFYSDYKA